MNAADRFDSLIRYYAERKDLEWTLVKAQIRQESGFDPDVVSSKGAVGLMQFMPKTWQEWRDETPGIQLPTEADDLIDPRDPEDSIRAGTAYDRWLLDRPEIRGDIRKALVAYNWGIGNLRRVLTSAPGIWSDFIPRDASDYHVRIARFKADYDAHPDPLTTLAKFEAAVVGAKGVLERALA